MYLTIDHPVYTFQRLHFISNRLWNNFVSSIEYKQPYLYFPELRFLSCGLRRIFIYCIGLEGSLQKIDVHLQCGA